MAAALLEKEVLGPKELVELLGKRPHGDYVEYVGQPEKDVVLMVEEKSPSDTNGVELPEAQASSSEVKESEPTESTSSAESAAEQPDSETKKQIAEKENGESNLFS